MTKSEKKKLIATNAGILVVGMLASFTLPLIMESVTDGRADFLKMIVHVGPLMVAIMVSTAVISKAVGEPAE
jgi:hypothetical protein